MTATPQLFFISLTEPPRRLAQYRAYRPPSGYTARKRSKRKAICYNIQIQVGPSQKLNLIVALVDSSKRSYTVRQISETPMPGTFHGDHLKFFRLRERYFISGKKLSLPVYQNIRFGTGKYKVPREMRKSNVYLGHTDETPR